MASRRCPLAVEGADAGGAKQLVTGKGVEVAVEGAHVDWHVRCALSAVDENGNAASMGEIDNGTNRVDRAQGVRGVCHGDDFFCALVQQLFRIRR